MEKGKEQEKGKEPERGKNADRQRVEQPPQDQPEATLRDISLVLDTYDDIFSDFDPRGYHQRELSEDFLKELARRHKEDRRGNFEVRFFIPTAMRDFKSEALIRKRIRDNFILEAKNVEKEKKNARNRGFKYAGFGIMFLIAEVLVRLYSQNELFSDLAGIILLPLGWFGVWSGAERVLDAGTAMSRQQAEFEKFAKCNYIFISKENE